MHFQLYKEFNEEVIQNLVGIPPQLRVKKVTCNQIYTKVRITIN
jgi:hypothetical protein